MGKVEDGKVGRVKPIRERSKLLRKAFQFALSFQDFAFECEFNLGFLEDAIAKSDGGA